MKTFARCLALALLLAGAVTFGAELPWRNKPFRMMANEKPVAEFLRELAASQGTTAVVDPKVTGVISGKFNLHSSAHQLLTSICDANGLTWYYDGSFLYIEPASEARSEVLPIAPDSAGRIDEALRQLKIADRRYPLAVSEREGTVFVSGPRRYVEMVRRAVKAVERSTAGNQAGEIRIFPLRYAWAGDFHLRRSGAAVVVPGVASTLRRLFSRGRDAIAGAGGRSSGLPIRVGPEREIRLRTGDVVNAPKVEYGAPANAGEADVGGDSYDGTLPSFQADSRLNAVIVRDSPERMAQYARLIEQMDVKPRLVEIELTIMDISTDTLDSLGIDWRLHGRRADLQTGTGERPALTWQNATTEAGQVAGRDLNGNPLAPAGAMFTAALGHEARTFLLARVNALAEKGRANFVARPKVLTIDNTEAVLENLSEIHVRVQGFQDAGLFSITSGTSVRVTPLIVDESTGRSVMLSIAIEDGSLSPNQAVDQIPVIFRRTVNTQALMQDGASLLLAGFTSEETINAVTGVPLLGDIPVLGALFRHTEKKQANMERFYMLTPRMVVPGTPAAGG
ncbi:MAG: type III secretion system outer membrane ring subunit SctC [Pseudomonadota bacterium]